MAKARKQQEEELTEDLSTEEKIKEAARTVFTKKGYAATRTRDIAEEAGINLALLNYYFRSKEKLFQQVMSENIQKLFGIILPLVTDATTKLDVKIELIASAYIDLIRQNPDLPLFVLSEIRNNPVQFKNRVPLDKILENSSLIEQLKERRPDIHPVQFLLNVLALCVFPFVSRPIWLAAKVFDEKEFAAAMEDRKRLIPVWVKAMLKAK
ncbi:TetR/AcrR family transcriptional regulator [Danxiaibacter flavus]|uniref:TetR/AcrR family transcriptional regulator n=1 Tax=Danxiaibacter flavus TaxID=3049108 RepID=A0ABV3ZEQ9_9BACT|nr:TetR/AcrR family transcriptional regulator [Chitinophagaceae bacterium DXS]